MPIDSDSEPPIETPPILENVESPLIPTVIPENQDISVKAVDVTT
jgi:hypothetical protein